MDKFSTQHVSATAVLTAHMRALETQRADRLIDDPYAACLVEASGIDMSAVHLSQVTGQRIFESNVVRTWWLDDRLSKALGQGSTQVVILGAGLDTRVARLNFPATTIVYEVDFDQVVAFKREVFARRAIEPKAGWQTIGADLTAPSDMVSALIEKGFDPTARTVWVAEGLLFYLDENASKALVAVAGSSCAADSELLVVHFGPGSQVEQQSKEMKAAAGSGGFGFQSYVIDPPQWLRPLGWTVEEATTIGQVGSACGRPVQYDVVETAGAEITWLIRAEGGRSRQEG